MKAKVVLVVLGVFALALVGCAISQAPAGAIVTEDGLIEFSAEGQSVVAKEDDALSLIEARVAAATMAKANLLEKIKGAFVSGSVTVGDLMFASQDATLSVEGFLARATVSYVEVGRVPAPTIVTAIASLTLDKDELENLLAYVE